jgi:hypothetical protein
LIAEFQCRRLDLHGNPVDITMVLSEIWQIFQEIDRIREYYKGKLLADGTEPTISNVFEHYMNQKAAAQRGEEFEPPELIVSETVRPLSSARKRVPLHPLAEELGKKLEKCVSKADHPEVIRTAVRRANEAVKLYLKHGVDKPKGKENLKYSLMYNLCEAFVNGYYNPSTSKEPGKNEAYLAIAGEMVQELMDKQLSDQHISNGDKGMERQGR